MATCPLCDEPYNPDRDIQRFCRVCKIWHHISCLASEGQRLPTGFETDAIDTHIRIPETGPDMGHFLSILRKPIQRGKYDGIVGNGRLLRRAWDVYDNIQRTNRSSIQRELEYMTAEFPEDWQVDRMSGAAAPEYYEYYECPTCHSKGDRGFL